MKEDKYKDFTKEQLAEAFELMEERVQLFMVECTMMSKTNYDLKVIKELIYEKKGQDIKDFCSMIIADSEEEDNPNGYVVDAIFDKAVGGIWSYIGIQN